MKKLQLEDIDSIRTSDNTYNNIRNVEEVEFGCHLFLVIYHYDGEKHAIRIHDVTSVGYRRIESKIKTQKDVYNAWKEGRLVEI